MVGPHFSAGRAMQAPRPFMTIRSPALHPIKRCVIKAFGLATNQHYFGATGESLLRGKSNGSLTVSALPWPRPPLIPSPKLCISGAGRLRTSLAQDPAPVVNNFATKEMEIVNNLPPRHLGSERKAPRPVRSTAAIPLRVVCRTPAGSRVPVQRSERTIREDPCISSTSDRRLARPQTPSTRKSKMKPWKEITHCAGFDWAHDHHAVVIVDRAGLIVADFEIEHNASGWQRWREQVAAWGLEWPPVWRPAGCHRAVARKWREPLSDIASEQSGLPGAQSAQW